MTTNGRVLTWGTGAERTDAHVPAYVPDGGIRLPPWVFDGEALADRLCRLKFEQKREIGDLFHEARICRNSAIHTQPADQAEARCSQVACAGSPCRRSSLGPRSRSWVWRPDPNRRSSMTAAKPLARYGATQERASRAASLLPTPSPGT